jgi:hypothetical protein
MFKFKCKIIIGNCSNIPYLILSLPFRIFLNCLSYQVCTKGLHPQSLEGFFTGLTLSTFSDVKWADIFHSLFCVWAQYCKKLWVYGISCLLQIKSPSLSTYSCAEDWYKNRMNSAPLNPLASACPEGIKEKKTWQSSSLWHNNTDIHHDPISGNKSHEWPFYNISLSAS